ncbi:MAG: hypothetical protein EI684_07105 [Candidatus Viridilinea halotolerans]|uniref:IPT/TIG domain-containing protein n=1 Tax=Candidatus Viridilinea halotolerans TaxID=2491704 RepID=A0A426U3N5_9CHLR|nr:MAG: hypothetical protein EI684_07105 [Candidatus Viridilinea halotolerans]
MSVQRYAVPRQLRFLFVLVVGVLVFAGLGQPANPPVAAQASGSSFDTIADEVVGQMNFLANTPSPLMNPTIADMRVPKGIAVSGGDTPLLFITDYDNNRVMIFNAEQGLADGRPAIACLGQTTCESSSPGVNQVGMNNPSGVATNGTGNIIYVADTGNHRILRFRGSFDTMPMPINADLVIGQSAYTNKFEGSGASGLKSPQGAALGSDGTLYVADTGNHRIQIFRNMNAATTNGPAANISLGAGEGSDLNQFRNPTAVALGPDGKLYVADTGNHRVLVFNPNFTNGQSASEVFGQTGIAGTTDRIFNGPTGVAVDEQNNLYVADKGNNRVLRFSQNATNNDKLADQVFGQGEDGSFTTGSPLATNNVSLNEPTGVAILPGFRDLLVADSNNHRVLTYFTPLPNPKPVISGFNPLPGTVVQQSDPPINTFSFTINGSDILDGANILWDGAEIFESITVDPVLNQVRIQLDSVNSSLLAGSPDTNIQIQVRNVFGPRSAKVFIASDPATYALCLPKPVIDTLTPNSSDAGGFGFQLVISGTNFYHTPDSPLTVTWTSPSGSETSLTVPNDLINWSNRITVPVASALLQQAGNATVEVANFSGGAICDNRVTSDPRNFSIGMPTPEILSFLPASEAVGAQPFTLRIRGNNFFDGAEVRWNGEWRTAIFSDSQNLRIDLSASDIPPLTSNPINKEVRVRNPSPTGTGTGPESAPRNFPFVANTAPRITYINPDTKEATSEGFVLTVFGANFTANTRIRWQSQNETWTTLPTFFIDAGQIFTFVPAGFIANPGSFNVQVDDPNDEHAASPSAIVRVTDVRPRIDSLSHTSANTGSPGFNLTITGAGFVGATRVLWNDQLLTPSSIAPNGSQLVVAIPNNLLTTPGTYSVKVQNPGNLFSDARSFEVSGDAPLPQGLRIDSFNPTSMLVGSTNQTLTINGNGFVAGSQVLWGTTPLTRQSLADDGRSMVVVVPSSLLTTPGSVMIRVLNPGGATAQREFLVRTAGGPCTGHCVWLPLVRR